MSKASNAEKRLEGNEVSGINADSRAGEKLKTESHELPHDTDKISVAEECKKTTDQLKKVADGITDASLKTRFTAEVAAFEAFVGTFSPEHPDNVTAYENLLAELGPRQTELVYSAYRDPIKRSLALINELTKDADSVKPETAVVVETLMEGLKSGKIQGAKTIHQPDGSIISVEERMFLNKAAPFGLDPKEAHEIFNSMDDAVKAMHQPLERYSRVFLAQGADVQQILENDMAASAKSWAQAEKSMSSLIPESTEKFKYETHRSISGGTWEDHARKVEAAIQEGKVQSVFDATIDARYQENGFLGLWQKDHNTRHYITTKTEYVSYMEDGKNKVTEVEVPRCTIYTTMRRHELWDKPLAEGESHWDKKSMDIMEVPLFDGRFNSITKIEQFREQLSIPPAQEMDDGRKVRVPIMDNKGNPNWLILWKRDYNTLDEVLEEGAKSFNSKGLTKEKFQASGDKQFLQELDAGMDSWIKAQEMYSQIEKSSKEFARKTGDAKLQADVDEALLNMEAKTREIQQRYGSSSQYEILARSRMEALGDYENGSKEWLERLHAEMQKVTLEYGYKDFSIRQIATEIQGRMQDIEAARIDMNLPAGERARKIRELENELKDLMRNMDYEVEIRTHARLMGIAYEDARKEVEANFAVIRRTEEVSDSEDKLNEATQKMDEAERKIDIPAFKAEVEKNIEDPYTKALETQRALELNEATLGTRKNGVISDLQTNIDNLRANGADAEDIEKAEAKLQQAENAMDTFLEKANELLLTGKPRPTTGRLGPALWDIQHYDYVTSRDKLISTIGDEYGADTMYMTYGFMNERWTLQKQLNESLATLPTSVKEKLDKSLLNISMGNDNINTLALQISTEGATYLTALETALDGMNDELTELRSAVLPDAAETARVQRNLRTRYGYNLTTAEAARVDEFSMNTNRDERRSKVEAKTAELTRIEATVISKIDPKNPDTLHFAVETLEALY